MAGGVVSGDVLRIDVLGILFGQSIVTTFAYQATTNGDGPNVVTDCREIAADFRAGTVNPFLAFLACCSPQYVADRIRVQDVFPVRYRAGFSTANLPGTNANATTSTNQAATITRGGKLAQRDNIGSIHIPGLANANMVGGLIESTFLGLMGTLATRMLNPWTSAASGVSMTPVLIQPFRPAVTTPPTKPARPFEAVDLVFAIPQETARTMRRRTVGVGK